MKLKIAEDLALPADVVTEKLAFLGRTGTGKTYAAMKLAELMLEAGAQVVALDAVGKWFGLRVDGPGPGFPIPVFGGLNGDFPLESTGGKLMAEVITDRGISAVLDVSQFTHSEQVRFALDFATHFFQRKKAAPSAVHLFLEECQEVVPQNAMPGEQAMLSAFERLWKLGRNFGIGGSLISQRPQEINKKALNQTGTLFVFGMTGPQERRAIEQWVSAQGINEDIAEILPTLQQGQPHVWSPTFLGLSRAVRIGQKRTADVSATPKFGARAKERPLTPIDAEQLRTEMAATIERARADDPRELRRQIQALERELKTKPADAAPAPRTIEVPYLPENIRSAFKALYGATGQQLEELRTRVRELSEGLDRELRNFSILMTTVHHGPNPMRRPPEPGSPAPRRPVNAHQIERKSGGGQASLGKCERGILNVLAQHPEGCERGKLTLLAGYRYSGGFKNALATLRTAGLIEGANTGTMRATAAGEAASDGEVLPTGAALATYWLTHPSFGKCERAILRALLDRPAGLDRDALLHATGYEYSGGFKNALANLRTAGVITGRNTETMRASDTLFD